jgi:hypothetical protein
MYPQSEILFPYRSITGLKHLRSEKWQSLVARVAAQPDGELDTISFSLLMIRQCDCLNCDMGSYKASLGCTPCSQRTIAGVKAEDSVLIAEFERAHRDAEAYLNGESSPPAVAPAIVVESHEPELEPTGALTE